MKERHGNATTNVPCRYAEFVFSAFGRPKARFVSHISNVDDLFAQDSNGRAVRTILWDGLQVGASGQRLDCFV